jgi:hypothetical protein
MNLSVRPGALLEVDWGIDINAGLEAAGPAAEPGMGTRDADSPLEVDWQVDVGDAGEAAAAGTPPEISWDIDLAEAAAEEEGPPGALLAAADSATDPGVHSSAPVHEAIVTALLEDSDFRNRHAYQLFCCMQSCGLGEMVTATAPTDLGG